MIHTRMLFKTVAVSVLLATTTSAVAPHASASHATVRGRVDTADVRVPASRMETGDLPSVRERGGRRNRRCRNQVLPQGNETVELSPGDFTTEIDNPYWPMTPGSTWTYAADDVEGTHEEVVIEVTDQTKTIANGVEARVIIDTVTQNGEIREQTEDWYAQDRCGNIWYLGEHVDNYENGVIVDNDGSFEAGVDGAQPGIAMPARPRPGVSYRQEYYAGVAEDEGAVITIGKEHVEVPFGFFDEDVLMTRDLVPLEPTVQELKFYGLGVGPLLSVHLDGTGGRSALVSFVPGA
jgi:hypothetical protein